MTEKEVTQCYEQMNIVEKYEDVKQRLRALEGV